jgi:DNA-binding transcriptional ArsR family regulator
MVELSIADRQPAALDQVFHALSDATRRAILRDITRGEKTVGEIAGPYAMSLAAVSKHLDVLERASLIRRERQGACRLVRLNPQPLAAAQDWLAFYEQFWSDNLDRLQEFLERSTEPAPEPAKPAPHRQSKAPHRSTKKKEK